MKAKLLLSLFITFGLCGCGFGPKSSSSAEPSSEPLTTSETTTSEEESSESHKHDYEYDDMSIHFLELGNKYTGDSTFIKVGDVDILIDAGSRQNSATAITNFINEHCEDGKLEYIIATHAHQDHIAGFVGSKANPGVLSTFKVGTLIQFALTNATSSIYNKYCELRDEQLATGNIDRVYTAAECVDSENEIPSTFTLTEHVTMQILDQKFYHEKTSDENDYSVCALFNNGEHHYLFTGDLEAKGEKSLVETNTLPKVDLFKGGHHGSYTANTDTLLDVIDPEVVCICCCAGSTEYTDDPLNTFPAQAAIDRIAKHTELIYVTTVAIDEAPNYTSMNGTISFIVDKEGYHVSGSNNSTILKETDWFKANRTWPS